MNIQENKRLVIQGYQKFGDKDIGALLEMFADDIEWEGARSEHLPFSGVYRGKQQAAQYFKLLGESVEAQQFEPQEFIAEGDKVVVLGQSRWTVKSNGNSYDSPWAHVLTIRNGKVARFQQYYDSAAAVEAFQPHQPSTQQTGGSPSARH
jgi:ketosteroid isomerase-like protein